MGRLQTCAGRLHKLHSQPKAVQQARPGQVALHTFCLRRAAVLFLEMMGVAPRSPLPLFWPSLLAGWLAATRSRNPTCPRECIHLRLCVIEEHGLGRHVHALNVGSDIHRRLPMWTACVQ